MMKKIFENIFLTSKTGKLVLNDVNVLSKYGHFSEAARLARKTLDENSADKMQMPKITSYERKILSGSYMYNMEKAKQHKEGSDYVSPSKS